MSHLKYKSTLLKYILVSLAIPLLAMQVSLGTIKAEKGSLYFSPGNATVQTGGQINVQVRGNGESYNATTVGLSYDANSLEFIGFSKNGSAFSESYAYITTSSSVQVTLYSTAATSGDNLLATFTFKALRNSGDSSITFDSNSVLVSNGDLVANGGSPLIITFTAPAAQPAPVSTPQQSNTGQTNTTSQQNSTPATTATQPVPSTKNNQTQQQVISPTVVAPSADTTKPELISSKVAGIIGEDIYLKLESSEPVKATVMYGNDKNKLANIANTETNGTSFYVSLGEVSKAFEKNKTYYYTVQLTDAAGNTITSPIEELSTESIEVSVQIKNKAGEVVKNTTVIINGKEYKTNKNGYVKIKDAIPGIVAVSLKNGSSEEFLGDVTVVAGVQQQAFVVSPNGIVAGAIESRNLLSTSYIMPGVISLVALVGGIAILRVARSRYYAKKEALLHSANPWGNNTPTISTYQPTPPATPPISDTLPTTNINDMHMYDATTNQPAPIIITPSKSESTQPENTFNLYSQYSAAATPPTPVTPSDDQTIADAAKKIVDNK